MLFTLSLFGKRLMTASGLLVLLAIAAYAQAGGSAQSNEGGVNGSVRCYPPNVTPPPAPKPPAKPKAPDPRTRIHTVPCPQPFVTIKNEEDETSVQVKIFPEGNYEQPNLPAGYYTVKAGAAGHLIADTKGFAVRVGKNEAVGWPRFELYRARIAGQVIDGRNQTLANAAVVLISEPDGFTKQVVTDERGSYSFDDLSPGAYTIKASWSDEQGESTNSLPVSLDRVEVAAPPIQLVEVIGPPQDTLQSDSDSSLPQGEQAAAPVNPGEVARRQNFTERQLRALPLGGASYMRSFDELALLAAGVAPPPYTPGARGPGVGFGVGTAGQFSVNGLRARSNNFSVDGSDNNDPDVGVRRQGYVALVPQPLETVNDVSIVTLLWDAELGRNSGSQVNVVTGYGGVKYHGHAYGFFTDSHLKARNFFDYSGGAAGGEDSFTRGQAGLAIGGPLRPKGPFFFAGYERETVHASTEQHFATPTRAERSFRNKFAAPVLGSLQKLTDVTPLGRHILSLYPEPNSASGAFGSNNYTEMLPADGEGSLASFKVTHQFPGEHRLSARYNFTDDLRVLPSVNRSIRSTLDARARAQDFSLIFDSPWRKSFFNHARISFGRTRLGFLEHAGAPFIFAPRPSVEKITLPQGTFEYPAQTGPIGELLIEPFSTVGVGVHYFPQRRVSNTFQVADTLLWLTQRHALKFGGNLRRYQFNNLLDRLYRPQVVYGGGLLYPVNEIVIESGKPLFPPGNVDLRKTVSISGVQLASLGVASSVLQTITLGAPDSTVGLRFTEYHLFINDNWRVRNGLTLDYGLRYEYNSVPTSADKRIERALTLEKLPALGDSHLNSQARTDKFNAAVNAYRQFLAGRNRIYAPDRNNFGPHLGFAWAPGVAAKTALRGGYGIYFDTTLGAVVTQSRNVFPNEIPINVDPSFVAFFVYSLNNPANLRLTTDGQGNFINPFGLLRAGSCNQFGTCNQLGGTPADFVALIGQLFEQNKKGGLAFTLPERDLRSPYTQHWHLTIERALFGDFSLSVAYVGTKGAKLTRLTTPNLGALATPLIPITKQVNDVTLGRTDNYSYDVLFNSLVGSAMANRPDARLGAYQVYENSASSNYHALQVEVNKRYSHGLQFTMAYTWSHAIDDVSDIFVIAGAPILPQDSGNLRLERSSANFDLRHRFAGSLIWDLPIYRKGSGGKQSLLGGWQIAAIFQAQTGQPFTLNIPIDANLDGNVTDRLSTTDDLIIFDGHGRQRVSATKPLESYFILNRDGVVGRNTLRGDSFINLDLALTKTFHFGDASKPDSSETRKLDFRVEFFNLFNRANFGLPIRILDAPGFGSAVDTVNPARMIQFALKYSF